MNFFAGVDSGDEDLTLLLPDVQLKTVQKFLELFYTGTTFLAENSDLLELQNFVQNQIQFSGQLDLNNFDVDHSYTGPRSRIESGKEKSQKNVFTENISAQKRSISEKGRAPAVRVSKATIISKDSVSNEFKGQKDLISSRIKLSEDSSVDRLRMKGLKDSIASEFNLSEGPSVDPLRTRDRNSEKVVLAQNHSKTLRPYIPDIPVQILYLEPVKTN